MIKTSIVVGLTGLAMLGATLSGVEALPFFASASTLVLAYVLYSSIDISKFLRIFLEMLAVTHLILIALIVSAIGNVIPENYQGYVPPASSILGTTAFAVIIYAISYSRVVRTICAIADRYLTSREIETFRLPLIGAFRLQEGSAGVLLTGALIAINLAQVAMNVRLSFFSRDLFNALGEKNADAFWYQLFVIFVPIAAVYVGLQLIEVFLQRVLVIRWRSYLNRFYVGEWLRDGAHYRMQLLGGQADNPDQRIAEDLRKYVEGTYSLSFGLMSQAATLVSFVAILWTISEGFTFPGTDWETPGLLVWVCVAYAAFGTVITHLIGRPLINLNFQQERFEADYRFSLARLREYAEQVALLSGENAEEGGLRQRFGRIVQNYMQITVRLLKLQGFTFSYFQANVVVPYLIIAPYYFIGKVSLGQMTQTVGAFSSVESALTYFISIYTTLADYKAVLDRLTTFEGAIRSAQRVGGDSKLIHIQDADEDLRMKNFDLRLPDGRSLVRFDNLSFEKGERTLLTGPSGSGKSTLFRAIAGIWPFGEGTVKMPQHESIMLLPQRPYIPVGSLRAAIAYPGMENSFDDKALAKALADAKLPNLAERLDEERAWAQTLSLGEQQRVAIARALLAKPDWLLLDEATAALDEPTEAEIYALIAKELPQTNVVSIGHRSTLQAFHDRHVALERSGEDLYRPADVEKVAAQ